jgi:hypothetical protein
MAHRALRVARLVGALLATTVGGARAAGPGVEAGFTYLGAHQNGNGSWPSSVTTVWHATTTVLETLRDAGRTSGPVFTAGKAYVVGQAPTLTDPLARKGLSLAGLGVDLSSLGTTLLARQNADGGFAPDVGFGSDVLDSALAFRGLAAMGLPRGLVFDGLTVGAGQAHLFILDVPAGSTALTILFRSLTAPVDVRIAVGGPPSGADPFFHVTGAPVQITLTPASFPALSAGLNFIRVDAAPGTATYSVSVDFESPQGSTAVASTAARYLLDALNTDGGWGLMPDDADSRVFFSVEAAWALLGMTDLTNAIDFLLARHNVDGGFGDLSTSTVFETALTTAFLTDAGEDPSALVPSPILFLRNQQLANGSWDDDPYETALALRVLAPLEPPGSTTTTTSTSTTVPPTTTTTTTTPATSTTTKPPTTTTTTSTTTTAPPSTSTTTTTQPTTTTTTTTTTPATSTTTKPPTTTTTTTTSTTTTAPPSTSTTTTSQPTTTTTTTVAPSTTTTTLPSSCPEGLGFAALRCRLDALAEALAAADVGKLRPSLERHLGRARVKLDRAEADLAVPAASVRALRSSARALAIFVHRLDSLIGRRTVDPADRRSLDADAAALRARLLALRGSIGAGQP